LELEMPDFGLLSGGLEVLVTESENCETWARESLQAELCAWNSACIFPG